VLEVSLRKAGFSVTPAVSVGDALEKLEINPPDLIISETKFATDLDGFELRRRLRDTAEWAEIPFMFLTAETAIENKIKGLELGVDEYLTKPIYIKEIVTRINILLQKKQRQFLDLRKDGTRFTGRVADMPVVDVIQTIEVSRKSDVINFSGGPNRQAAIYFRDGKVIDAEAGTLQGEDAVYRLLTWNDGDFEVEFRTVRRREVIEASSQGLLMEGMRRLDEWSRLLEQLPPLTHRFEIDAVELSTRLGEVPDDNNRILRLFDGRRTLLEVIDASDFGDLECLQAVSRLYFEGLLIDLDHGTKRDSGRHSAPSIAIPDATPLQSASGQIPIEHLAAQDATMTASGSIPVDPTDVVGSEPLVSPGELAAEMHRRRRPSSQPIEDGDVVGEEELHGPLSGGYRPSSRRLIDEAVAAAQLIEPSLFSDDELAAAGVKREPPGPVQINPRNGTNGTNGTAGTSGRRSKTLPPPLPARPPMVVSGEARAPSESELTNAPLLDSSLLTSGEIKIPSESDLADAPLLDSSLLTSGEI
jgi:DNA-binding response OmpR family regulator